AAFVQRQIFGAVGQRALPTRLRPLGGLRLGRGGERRQTAVRRIDDQRGPAAGQMPRARIPPVGSGGVVRVLLALDRLLLVARRFVGRQRFALGERRGALERRHRRVVPDAREVTR